MAKKKKAAKKAAAPAKAPAPAPAREFPLRPACTMETSLGSFTFELFVDEAPTTAANYLDLLERGFYEGLHVHRVVPGFVVQLGCPHTRDPASELAGQGAPPPLSTFATVAGDAVTRQPHPEDPDGGYLVPDEFEAPRCSRRSNAKYTLSAANAGPRSTGSQFFVNLADNDELDWFSGDGEDNSQHVVFGRLLDGAETIEKIHGAPRRDEVPTTPVKILAVAVAWPSPEAVKRVLAPEPGPRVAHVLFAYGGAVSARTDAAAACASKDDALAAAGRLLARLRADPAAFALAAFARSDCASYRYGGDCGPLAASGAGPAEECKAEEPRPPEPAKAKPAKKPGIVRRLSDRVLKASRKVDPALGAHAPRPQYATGCLLESSLLEAARNLAVGALSDPIASPAGVHVLLRTA